MVDVVEIILFITLLRYDLPHDEDTLSPATPQVSSSAEPQFIGCEPVRTNLGIPPKHENNTVAYRLQLDYRYKHYRSFLGSPNVRTFYPKRVF